MKKLVYTMLICGNIWELNITNMSKDLTNLIYYQLGRIPSFIVADADNIEQTALDRYQFGGPELSNCTITSTGILQYPRDPDMYPIAICRLPERNYIIYVYDMGMIAFVNLNNDPITWKVYRFD